MDVLPKKTSTVSYSLQTHYRVKVLYRRSYIILPKSSGDAKWVQMYAKWERANLFGDSWIAYELADCEWPYVSIVCSDLLSSYANPAPPPAEPVGAIQYSTLVRDNTFQHNSLARYILSTLS